MLNKSISITIRLLQTVLEAFTTAMDKKVSCRRQIARQHSCHKKVLARAWNVVNLVKIVLSFSLITTQNLITVSHTVGYCGGLV